MIDHNVGVSESEKTTYKVKKLDEDYFEDE